jgi:hypothetical protein
VLHQEQHLEWVSSAVLWPQVARAALQVNQVLSSGSSIGIYRKAIAMAREGGGKAIFNWI